VLQAATTGETDPELNALPGGSTRLHHLHRRLTSAAHGGATVGAGTAEAAGETSNRRAVDVR
jgi:hypothetical protein